MTKKCEFTCNERIQVQVDFSRFHVSRKIICHINICVSKMMTLEFNRFSQILHMPILTNFKRTVPSLSKSIYYFIYVQRHLKMFLNHKYFESE